MSHQSCPAALVEAPVETVWRLLTDPAGWDRFFDLRVLAVEPPGAAVVGQRIRGDTGFGLLRLRVAAEFINPGRHGLGLMFRLPFGIANQEWVECSPLGPDKCRVNYRCTFDFPAGWRGRLLQRILRRLLDTGPLDSLHRLKRAAERMHASQDRQMLASHAQE